MSPKSRKTRLFLWAGGGLLLAAMVSLLALPMLVNVDGFRATIEEGAEAALGRQVQLGSLKLSVFPSLAVQVKDVKIGALPGESREHLLTAAGLRVGARLLPLLGKRLEVTSIVLEEPSLALERGADGVWNVQQLAGPADPAATGTGSTSKASGFSVDRLRISGGTILLRQELPAGGQAAEVTVSDLDLRVGGLSGDEEVDLKLSAGLSLGPDCRIRLTGTAVPAAGSGELRLAAQLEIDDLPADEAGAWVENLGAAALPAGMLGKRLLSARAAIEASFLQSEAGTALARAQVDSLRLEGLDLTVRRVAGGGWDVFELLENGDGDGKQPSSPAPTVSLAGIELENARVRFVDQSGVAPLDVVFDPLSLHLDRLPDEQPATIRLTSRIAVAGGKSKMSLEGSFGPVADGSLPMDVRLELEKIPFAAAAPFLVEYLEVAKGRGGALDLSVHAAGDASKGLDLSGILELRGVEAQVVGVDNRPRALKLDTRLDYEVRVDRGGEALVLRRFDVALAGNQLRFRGNLDRSAAVTTGTISLLPTSFNPADLVGLLSVAGVDLPLSLTGSTPMKIELEVQGPLGGEDFPSLKGRLEVQALTLRHLSMEKPLEAISGVVSVAGQTVQVTGFSARMGGSDVAGSLTLKGFDTPHVRFDLRSEEADFWELVSFVSGTQEDGADPGRRQAAARGGVPAGVVAEGTLRIGRGSFQTLRFRDLEAGLKFEGQQLTLTPLAMNLYAGNFAGSASLDLATTPASFRLHSDVSDLDIDPLLTENLDSPGLLLGRFSGVLDVTGSGTDYDTIVKSLQGGGRVEVTQGAVGKLDVLKVLSKASDVFGERTLKTLSKKLEKEGTEFESLTATLTLGRGRMTSKDLLLQSVDLNLEGGGFIELMAATLDGDFQVVFSQGLSQSMEQEGSRAAKIFWDPGINRVSLPLGLTGPFETPTPSIDWSTAAKRVASRKVEDQVRGRLGSLLGGKKQTAPETPPEKPAAAETPPQQLSGQEAAEPAAAAEPPVAPAPAGLQATITSTDWGGSILAKDLHIKGTVEGKNLAQASLTVVDARGNQVHRVEKIDALERHFNQPGSDRTQLNTIAWSTSVDGKRIVLAKSPFTIQIEVTTTDGQTVTTTKEVRK